MALTRDNENTDHWPRWLDAVGRLRPVPPDHYRATLDPAGAARQLGCAEGLVEELVKAGLPAEQTPDGPRLDYHDVMNLGLGAGLGGSLAEQAEARCMRMATGPREGWLTERTWRLRLGAPCSAPQCPGAQPAAPAPELLGGELSHFGPFDGPAGGGGPVQAVADVVTRGSVDAPRTAAVREVYDDVLHGLTSGTYQYGWLPRTMRSVPDVAVGLRMLDCVVAAWLMEQRARDAGLRARTRKGFLLGLVGVEHAWTEVLEEGRWLPLDPVLAFLALRQPAADPGFTDFCRGSVHNRLLSWPVAADQPLTEHDCAYGGHIVESCTLVPAPRPAAKSLPRD